LSSAGSIRNDASCAFLLVITGMPLTDLVTVGKKAIRFTIASHPIKNIRQIYIVYFIFIAGISLLIVFKKY